MPISHCNFYFTLYHHFTNDQEHKSEIQERFYSELKRKLSFYLMLKLDTQLHDQTDVINI